MKIFNNEKSKERVIDTYDQLLTMWGVDLQETDIETRYGSTHVISCGDVSKLPLVLFHGVGDNSALMWIFNARELGKYFHVYAVDTIGGPGKSCPNENYNKTFDQILWMDEVFQKLNIDKAYIAGVSNGSYIAQHYGIIRPEKVLKIVCMAGSIISKGTPHPMKRMMKVFLPEALIPTGRNVIRLIKKLTGDNYSTLTENIVIMEHYKYLLRGFNNMAMGYHKIEFFDDDQIRNISGKCLFLCGDVDPLGDCENDKEKFEKYQLDYQLYEGVGHGINHEISTEINQRIIEYFTLSQMQHQKVKSNLSISTS